ncbi:MAG: HAMP domain-containing histidine kinase [Acidimicrobiia bacterium]|nr:HAMP domain-containing histidine kinase [Acidimicrobiia bacterium]
MHERSVTGPSHRMFRRFAVGAVVVLMSAVALGALIATGLTALTGGRRLAVITITVLVALALLRRARRGAGRSWQPIGQLIDATNRLGEGEAGVRVPEGHQGPMRAVAESFNRMAQRLEDEDDRRNRLFGDLSHELRTPLSILRGEVEALKDGIRPSGPGAFSSMLDDIAVMERLLVDLQTAALTESGRLELHRAETSLSELCRDAVAPFETSAADRGVTLRQSSDGDVWVFADPIRIRQIIGNLLTNALRHTPAGGRVTVDVRPVSGGASVTVSDTGPGIPPDQLAHVFDRFVKAADSTGSGLGLSIARDLARAHGGDLTADQPGPGARFTLTLPEAAGSPPS